jgi:uncharacterized protein DUF4013
VAELTGPAAPPAPTVGDAFGWAARDPEWIGKLLLMGLIGLIPIVGALQQTGWLLAMLDNLRAGRNEVPAAGFRYATRGVWLWLAAVIYNVALVVVLYGSLFVVVLALVAGAPPQSGTDSGSSSGNPAVLLLVPFFFLWVGVIGIVALALWAFVPVIIEFTDRTGLAGAFNFPGLFRAIRLDPTHNLAAAGLAFVAYIIAGLGTYLCWIGVIFTLPYGITVLAGVLRWYEVSVKPEALPPPSAASAR